MSDINDNAPVDPVKTELPVETEVDDAIEHIVPKKDRARMAQWLFFAVVFYVIAAVVAMSGIVEIRTAGAVCQKMGNVTLASFVGYWIDRSAFKERLTPDSETLKHIRRAVIIAACIIAVSGGF